MVLVVGIMRKGHLELWGGFSEVTSGVDWGGGMNLFGALWEWEPPWLLLGLLGLLV